MNTQLAAQSAFLESDEIVVRCAGYNVAGFNNHGDACSLFRTGTSGDVLVLDCVSSMLEFNMLEGLEQYLPSVTRMILASNDMILEPFDLGQRMVNGSSRACGL